MRTPQEAYNEAIQILIERHTNAAATIVTDKPSYQLGLHVAIEQLKMSFYGVFDQPVASTQEPEPEKEEYRAWLHTAQEWQHVFGKEIFNELSKHIHEREWPNPAAAQAAEEL